METVIKYTDIYIPNNVYSIDEYIKELDESYFGGDLSREDIACILKYSMGVEKVYVEDRKKEASIFAKILEKYFSNTNPEEIDYIIYTRGNSIAVGDPWGLSDDECINVPYFIQNKYGLKNAQVFNVEQECSGTLIALKLALSIMKDDSVRKILILSSNFFESAEKRLMGGMIVVSDGLGVLEVSKSDTGLAMIDFMGKTEGKISKVKELSNPANAQGVVKTGTDLIKKLLNKNNLEVKDMSIIIPQNISKNTWNYYCEMLQYPKERVFLENGKDGGHMGDVDIIRNITSIMDKGILNKNEYALAYGLGTGTSWNSLLLKSI